MVTVILAAMGKSRWGAPARAASASVVFALAAAACTSDDATDNTNTTSSSLASCADERHVVVFDYFGTITLADSDLGDWLADPANAVPPARPGGADLANAYRASGFEILYLTTTPEEVTVADKPVRAEIGAWLVANGFPLGDRANLWVWDGEHTPMRGIANELDRIVSEGAVIDAAYTDNPDKAFAFKTAVPSEGVHTIGAGSGTSGVTPVPADDMVAHAAEVAGQDPVCRSA